MKKQAARMFRHSLYFTALAVLTLAGCNKEKHPLEENLQEKQLNGQDIPDKTGNAGRVLSKVMTVARVRAGADGSTQVLFNENAQVLTVTDEQLANALRQHYTNHTAVNVSFNPWEAKVTALADAPQTKKLLNTELRGKPMPINLATTDASVLDESSKLGTINTTTPGLVNIIPDMATAQLMFNYITQQCCAIPGPYEIDQCISFQYAYDGCYARAHKMCWILNNTYRYATHKIFSFANAGSDVLSVHAQKWGGCCINWWYHVAPLVNIKTPSGVKAYVFDPAMFNQPVLLSVWLHAQENPVCAGPNAHVSMINLQPTQSYSPSDYSGYFFDLDPWYWSTNYTLNNYSGLTTCW